MAAVFGPKANLITKLVLCGGVAGLLTLAGAGWIFPSINYYTRVDFVQPQPVPFSHEHHVSELGIDCRYCHTSVEVSANAGLPATHTCMTCHSQLWTNADMLAPVRQSLARGEPIRWNRVYDLPDYVFFNHSIHVAKGVGCAECHGRVDKMALMRSEHPLQMRWCLECHRNPEEHLRPKEAIFSMTWKADDQAALGARLAKEYQLRSTADLTSCNTCHR